MNRAWQPLIWFFLLTVCGQALAAPQYQADVVVQSQQASDREAAIVSALQQVLINVSGNKNIVALAGVQAELPRAPQFVQSYTYHRDPTQHTLLLNVTFDTAAIDNIVRQQGQNFSGDQRPILLVWMAIEDEKGTRMVGADEPPSLRHVGVSVLLAQAAARGVMMTLPALDLEDTQIISVRDIGSQNINRLLQASQRYALSDMLLISLAKVGTRWVGQWTLYYRGQPIVWQLKSDDVVTLMNSGINHITDLLVARQTSQSETQATKATEMRVVGIKSVADHTRLLNLLRRLDGVVDVQVASVQSDAVIYRVAHAGDIQNLQDKIVSLEQLQSLTDNARSTNLQYRLLA